jgi:hypothetical protein
MKDNTNEVEEALLDLLDMLGALSGDSNELYGWGLSRERQQEIWDLGQKLSNKNKGITYD